MLISSLYCDLTLKMLDKVLNHVPLAVIHIITSCLGSTVQFEHQLFLSAWQLPQSGACYSLFKLHIYSHSALEVVSAKPHNQTFSKRNVHFIS